MLMNFAVKWFWNTCECMCKTIVYSSYFDDDNVYIMFMKLLVS